MDMNVGNTGGRLARQSVYVPKLRRVGPLIEKVVNT
jgi:hypothetical protein